MLLLTGLQNYMRFVRDELGTLEAQHRRRPDVAPFLVGPQQCVLVSHPEGIAHVLTRYTDRYDKGTRGMNLLRMVLGNGLLTSEGEFWRKQRRIAQPAFHRNRIAHFADTMTACTDSMLETWPQGVETRAIPFHDAMTRLTLRIIGLTMLSADVEGDAKDVGEALTTVLSYAADATTNPFLHPALPTRRVRAFHRARKTLEGIVDEVIAKRRSSGDSGNDLLGMLMDARYEDTGEGMGDAQLRDEVMTIFLAGHETTANALTWTFHLLGQHPDIAAAHRQELDRALAGRAPTLQDLAQLPFNRQIFEEAMRLLPPVWLIPRRAITDDEIMGVSVPKGSFVFTSPYITHRDPRWWPDPLRFDPRRFEGKAPDRPKLAYFPFGAGPRMCVGTSFAQLEGQLLLARIAQRYHLRAAEGRPLPTLHPKVTLRALPEAWLEARPRLPFAG